MKRFGTAAIVSLCVAFLGVIVFILAVTGLLFEGRTPVMDVGMWSVILVLFSIGGLGFWAAMAEKKQREREDTR